MDRKIFFDEIRPLFGKFSVSQVNGTSTILDEYEAHWTKKTSVPQLAYVLATPWLETDATMQPIHEYGNRAYFTRMYDINGARPAKARELGNIHPGDGAKFPGMGYVQSTGRANARRNTVKLRAMGAIGSDVDFEKSPELMMLPQYAVLILFAGMEEGWFTGVKLDDVIDDKIDGDEHADFLKGRRIINGKDRAEKIATAADKFLKALQKAGA